MLAYVFWHWKAAEVRSADYEARQRAFHAALDVTPPGGFQSSFSLAITRVPWANNGGDAYEDWYLLTGFGALGALNEAAVSGARAVPHGAAAAMAGGGAGGIYALRRGRVRRDARHALWFAKPEGMGYAELFDQLSPLADEAQAALWMRQLTLGPAPEFCLHSEMPVIVPALFRPLVIALRTIWPKSVRTKEGTPSG